MNLRINDDEDPYRSFRRELIKNQREGSAKGKRPQDYTTRSRESKNHSAFSLHSGSQMAHKSIAGYGDYDTKAMNSQITLEKNKIIENSSISVQEMLSDLKHPLRMRGSLDGSNYMIEVNELDSPMGRGKQTTDSSVEHRAQTTKGALEVNLKMEPYGGAAGRYGPLRNNTKTIVANARRELDAMQRSYLPPSRMSAQNPTGLGGLPPRADTSYI